MIGIALAVAVLCGVLLRDAGVGWYIAPLIVTGVCLALAYRADRSMVAVVVVAVAGFGAGTARAGPTSRPELPANFEKQSVLVGKVLHVPRRYAGSTRAQLGLETPARVTLDAWLPSFPIVAQGDIIRVVGTMGDSNSGRLRWSAEMSPQINARSVTILRSEATWSQRLRARITGGIGRRLSASIPQPVAALATGIVQGDDGAMTSASRDAFRAAGLSHITAVSGWNVALVAGLLESAGRRFRLHRRTRLLLAATGIWGFAYLVGLDGSVTRAAVMANLYLWAMWRGRPTDALAAVAWATVGIILVLPAARFDIGFQLSVAATFGLVLGMPLIGRQGWLATNLAVPLIAEIAVAPLLLYHFGSYSLLSPLANVLVCPLIPAIMYGAVVTTVLACVHPLLGQLAGVGVWLPGRFVMGVAEWSGSVTWASGRMPTLGFGGVVVAYAALAGLYGLAVGYQNLVDHSRQPQP